MYVMSVCQESLEQDSMQKATHCMVFILYEKCETAVTSISMRDNKSHVTLIIDVLEFFECTWENWNTKPVTLQWKQGVSPCHWMIFLVPCIQEATLCREVERLVTLGVLELWLNCKWAASIFIIPKQNVFKKFISHFLGAKKMHVL